MGKEFCIPTYLPDEIKFGNTIIPLAEIKSWLFDDLLTTSEIA